MKTFFGFVSALAFVSSLAACGGNVDVREPIGSAGVVYEMGGDEDAAGTAGGDSVGTTTTSTDTGEDVDTGTTTGTDDDVECHTDADCAQYNGECLVFWCGNSMCFADEVDADGDSHSLCGGGAPGSWDCNDGNPDINPYAEEQCNGVDDNCNGETDEDCGLYDTWISLNTFSPQGTLTIGAKNTTMAMQAVMYSVAALPSPIKRICFTWSGTGQPGDVSASLEFWPAVSEDEFSGLVALIPDASGKKFCADDLGWKPEAGIDGSWGTADLYLDFSATTDGLHQFSILEGDIELEDGGEVKGDFPLQSQAYQLDQNDEPLFESALDGSDFPQLTGCTPENAATHLFQFAEITRATAVNAAIAIEIRRIDDAYKYVKGSAGTPYFTHLTLVDVDGAFSQAGPLEISPSKAVSSTTSSWLKFEGPTLDVPAFTTRHFYVNAKLACQEDYPGEFFGGTYAVVKRAIQLGDLTDLATGESLDSAKTWPQEEIIGHPFQVVAP